MANQVYQSNMQPYGQNNDSYLWGSPERVEQLQNYSPNQNNAMDQALQQGLQGSMNNFDFAPIEEQARTGFAQKTIPGIAERFSSLGSGGQRSSAFFQSLGQAGAGLDESLASMKKNYNLQMMPMMQNLMNMGLNRRYENAMHARVPGMVETGLSSLLGGLSSGLGLAATGGMGHMMGMFGNSNTAGQQFGSPMQQYGNPMQQYGNQMQGLNRSNYQVGLNGGFRG